MNKILKLSAILLGAAVVATGCIKEPMPQGSGVIQEQVSESPFAFSGIASSIPTTLITNYLDVGDHYDFGYPGLMGCTDRLVGDMFPACWYAGGNQYYDRYQPYMYNRGMSYTGAGPYFFWLNYYQFIKSTNDLLSITEGVESEDAKIYCGLGKAFRALYYLDLVRLYDALPAKAPKNPAYEASLERVKGLTVPWVDYNTTQEMSVNNPRMTRQEAFTHILDDLNAAAINLAEYTQTGKALPSLACVYGLLARTYLWLGGYDEPIEGILTGVDAYKEAAKYARQAITASGATPMTKAEWTDPKTGFNTTVSSWMWSMIQTVDTVLNNLLSFTAHNAVEAQWGYGFLAQPGLPKYAYERLSNTDFRKLLIKGEETTYEQMQPYTSLSKADWETVAPYAFFKFRPAGGEQLDYTTGNVTDIPLMRVEEMYFIEMEATAHYDQGTARNLLTSFMTSHRDAEYKVPATVASLVDEIIFQKRIEFWGEGVVFYDFKRLNMGINNGYDGSNTPAGARWTTDGRAPWWNIVIPIKETSQNKACDAYNNPNPQDTYDSNDENI